VSYVFFTRAHLSLELAERSLSVAVSLSLRLVFYLLIKYRNCKLLMLLSVGLYERK